MKVKPLTLINIILATVLLTSILFSVMTVNTSSSVGEYDPWIDYNDDGRIDHKDLFQLAAVYGTTGTPINKTALLLELLARVEALENKTRFMSVLLLISVGAAAFTGILCLWYRKSEKRSGGGSGYESL